MDLKFDRLEAQADQIIETVTNVNELIANSREYPIKESQAHLDSILKKFQHDGELNEKTRMNIMSLYFSKVAEKPHNKRTKKQIDMIQW